MPLATRVLTVLIDLPNNPVTLTQDIDMHVQIRKDALALQQFCSIDIFNLSTSLRENLLSQFTAWNKRNLETGQSGVSASYIDVTISAGYTSSGKSNASQVFKGQVVLVTPTSGPPSIGVRIECYSQQLPKLQFVTGFAPTNVPFKQYVAWVAAQMGVDRYVCETSYDDVNVSNPSGSTHIVGNLIIDVQNAYRPNVAAFIDDNVLYVKDVNKVLSAANTATVKEFIGIPMWTEWGVKFQTLFDPTIKLAGAASLQSSMNPSLDKTFVIYTLEYSLSSRKTPFYVSATASPAAS